MAKKDSSSAPDEKAPVVFTVSDANQLNSLAAALDSAYDSTAQFHENTIVNHAERGQMRLNQVFDLVTSELRSMARRLLDSASTEETPASQEAETPPVS